MLVCSTFSLTFDTSAVDAVQNSTGMNCTNSSVIFNVVKGQRGVEC